VRHLRRALQGWSGREGRSGLRARSWAAASLGGGRDAGSAGLNATREQRSPQMFTPAEERAGRGQVRERALDLATALLQMAGEPLRCRPYVCGTPSRMTSTCCGTARRGWPTDGVGPLFFTRPDRPPDLAPSALIIDRKRPWSRKTCASAAESPCLRDGGHYTDLQTPLRHRTCYPFPCP